MGELETWPVAEQLMQMAGERCLKRVIAADINKYPGCAVRVMNNYNERTGLITPGTDHTTFGYITNAEFMGIGRVRLFVKWDPMYFIHTGEVREWKSSGSISVPRYDVKVYLGNDVRRMRRPAQVEPRCTEAYLTHMSNPE